MKNIVNNLPESITLCHDGTVLHPVIGGRLDGKPFLTVVDVTRNGWLSDLPSGVDEHEAITRQAKRLGLKYRRIYVLPKTLRGKLDLHGRTYKPTLWVFVEVR